MGHITTDVDEFRAWLMAEALELGLPQIPSLTADEKRAILRGDRDALARLGPELVNWAIAVINAPTDYVAKHSYGFREKRSLAEAILKRAMPETVQVDVHEFRHVSDRELLDLVGLVVEGEVVRGVLGQKADSAQEAQA